ncbi:hypothetical protein GQ457_04G000730 [Hibiscus cannabinus]
MMKARWRAEKEPVDEEDSASMSPPASACIHPCVDVFYWIKLFMDMELLKCDKELMDGNWKRAYIIMV